LEARVEKEHLTYLSGDRISLDAGRLGRSSSKTRPIMGNGLGTQIALALR